VTTPHCRSASSAKVGWSIFLSISQGKSTNPEISPSFTAAVYTGVAETRVVCADP
jgi:hypothetical protein